MSDTRIQHFYNEIANMKEKYYDLQTKLQQLLKDDYEMEEVVASVGRKVKIEAADIDRAKDLFDEFKKIDNAILKCYNELDDYQHDIDVNDYRHSLGKDIEICFDNLRCLSTWVDGDLETLAQCTNDAEYKNLKDEKNVRVRRVAAARNGKRWLGLIYSIQSINDLIQKLQELHAKVDRPVVKESILKDIKELEQLRQDIVAGDKLLLKFIVQYHAVNEILTTTIQTSEDIRDWDIVSKMVDELFEYINMLKHTIRTEEANGMLHMLITKCEEMKPIIKSNIERKIIGNYKLEHMDSLFSSLKHRIAVLESCARKLCSKAVLESCARKLC